MNIELSDNEIKKIGQLRNCLTSGSININDIRIFLEGLEQKIDEQTAPPDPGLKTRVKKKQARKNKYRQMIAENIHGNKKLPG